MIRRARVNEWEGISPSMSLKLEYWHSLIRTHSRPCFLRVVSNVCTRGGSQKLVDLKETYGASGCHRSQATQGEVHHSGISPSKFVIRSFIHLPNEFRWPRLPAYAKGAYSSSTGISSSIYRINDILISVESFPLSMSLIKCASTCI